MNMIGPGTAESDERVFILFLCLFNIIPEFEPFISGHDGVQQIKPQDIRGNLFIIKEW